MKMPPAVHKVEGKARAKALALVKARVQQMALVESDEVRAAAAAQRRRVAMQRSGIVDE